MVLFIDKEFEMNKFVYSGKEVADYEAAHHLSMAYPYAIDKFEQCQEVYLLAVKTKAGYLKKVPAAYRSRELLYAAVEANGLSANFLTDEEMGDEGLLIAALKNNGSALQGIRERMPVNEKLLDAAAASSEDSHAAAYMLPEELTEERCVALVQSGRDNLWLLPREKQTPAVCRAALVKWGRLASNHIKDRSLAERIEKELGVYTPPRFGSRRRRR